MTTTQRGAILGLILAHFVLFLSSQQVYVSPVIRDTNFGDFVIVGADQLPNHSVSIQYAPSLTGPWFELAGYSCYPESQVVMGTFPVRPWYEPYFFRSVNSPCFTNL